MGGLPEFIILDAMGVIYKAGDDVGELLIPFLRSKGCAKSEDDIENLYLECSLGNLTSREFWEACGIPVHDGLDDEYIQQHVLTDGLMEFLRSSLDHGIKLVCLSNDVAEWSVLLRKRHGLEGYIDHWFISGDLGVRKPDEGIYSIMIDKLGVEPGNCVFLDDRVHNLRTARNLGLRVLLFGSRLPVVKDIQSALNFKEARACILNMK